MIGAIVFAIVVIIGAFFGLLYITRSKFRVDGLPTLDSARVKIEVAENKVKAETDAAAKGVRNATLDENIARAKSVAARGKLRND